MRGTSFVGRQPKEILKGREGYCKKCHKHVHDLLAHRKAKHCIPTHLPKPPRR